MGYDFYGDDEKVHSEINWNLSLNKIKNIDLQNIFCFHFVGWSIIQANFSMGHFHP